MQIFNCSNHETLSAKSAGFILNNISSENKTVASFAAGESTKDTYKYISEHINNNQRNKLHVVQMDEYIGFGPESQESLYSFVKHNIITQFKIDPQNVISLDGKCNKPMTECHRYQQALKKIGTLDICVLGMGINGHVAFNEPGSHIEEETRILTLDYIPSFYKQNTDMIQVITIGLKEIFASKNIVLIISGNNKKYIAEKFLNSEPTNNIPATLLKNHTNLNVFINDELFK